MGWYDELDTCGRLQATVHYAYEKYMLTKPNDSISLYHYLRETRVYMNRVNNSVEMATGKSVTSIKVTVFRSSISIYIYIIFN